MMKNYARIEGGIVAELFETDGDIAEMFHPDLVWVEVPKGCSPQVGWVCIGDEFSPTEAPQPSAEEILSANMIVHSSLLSSASQSMTPVLVSLQLGNATDEETNAAKEWQSYYRALQSVDLTSQAPEWPIPPA